MAKEPKRYTDDAGNYFWKWEDAPEVEVVEEIKEEVTEE